MRYTIYAIRNTTPVLSVFILSFVEVVEGYQFNWRELSGWA
ncbi:MAG: hypothetical protein ABIL62_02335 [Planctomycetota bacterium]